MKTITKKLLAGGLTFVILFLTTHLACAQFPFNIGGAQSQTFSGRSIATDASNNMYVTGSFSGTVDFKGSSGTPHTLTSVSDADIYIAKYNVSGVCQWVFNIGKTGTSFGYGIATDATGNVYVTGSYEGTADFDPSNGTANLTCTGNDAIFVAKYSAAGVYQWAFNIGEKYTDKAYSIATDALNNVYVTGNFQDTTDFDPSGGTAILTKNSSVQDIFVAKYSSAGAYQWAFNIGATDQSLNQGSSVITDASGNILITGAFSSTADFKGTSGASKNLTGVGIYNCYIAKYNSTGVCQWAFGIGGFLSVGSNLALDPTGNVLVTGSIYGSADFDPSANTVPLTSVGMGDIFVAKYNSAGAYQWALNAGSADGQSIGNSIVADATGNVFVTGSFEGTVDFDPSGSTAELTSAAADDIFVARYNAAGIYQCAFNIGSAADNSGDGTKEGGEAITIDAFGNVVVAGNFAGTADFDPSGAEANLTPVGIQDAFISKYSGCTLNAGGGCAANAGSNQSICQGVNNSVTIGGASTSGHTYSWSPSAGLSSSTVSQPTATPSSTTTYTLTETVTATSCQATATVVVFVGVQPATPVITPSGPITFCTGANVTLNLGSSYTNYSWSNGATTQNITTGTQGDYSVTVSNAPGCSAVSSVISVTVNTTPAANVGPNKGFCPGGSTTIGAAEVIGNTYSWSPSAGLSSSTVSQPTASPSINTTYTLTETAGVCQATHTVIVILSPVPSVPVISASGSTTICAGESVTLHVVNTYTTYSWSNGGSTQNINVTTQGSYSVTVTNGSGCSAASSATTVTVNPAPATPGISKKGDTLLCSVTADSYQWYRNSALLTGATNNYYLPTQGGDYTVTITEGGCSATSSPFTWTAIVSVSAGNGQVIIYPLPASAYFIAESKTTALQTITLYDVLGKRVLNAEIKDVSVGADDKKARINIGGLTAGVYFVQLRTAGAVSTLRLVKE